MDKEIKDSEENIEQNIEEKKEDNLQNIIENRKEKIKTKFFGWVEDNYDKAFLGILVIAFIIRFLIFLNTKDQAIWWDAADYLATAKRWAGVNLNLIDMWYYRRGMFWPLFCSVFFKLGLGEKTIGLAYIVLFSTGTIAVSYFLIRKMFNKKLALFVSLGVTFSWIFLFFTGRPSNEIPATFFLLLSLLFFWKGYVLKEHHKFVYLFGLFFALACSTRMQYLMFAIPFLAIIFTQEKFKFLKNKHLWIVIGIFLIIFIPQIIMHWQHFGNPLSDLTKYYLGVGSSKLGETGVKLEKTSDLFLYFNNLPYILDGNNKGYNSLFVISPIYILFVIGFFYFFADLFFGFDKLFKNKEIQKKFFILVWIISTFMFLGYMAPQVEQRYMMQTLPFLFLISVYPFKIIEKFLIGKFGLKQRIIVILLFFILILLLVPNFIFANGLIENKKISYIEVKQAGLWIKEHSNPEDLIVSGSLPQTTYYSERSTYPFNLAYRRDLPHGNESDFDEFVKSKKPRYMTLSIFEKHEDWAYKYPEKHPDLLIPVKAYTQGDQPVLIIYEFNYS